MKDMKKRIPAQEGHPLHNLECSGAAKNGRCDFADFEIDVEHHVLLVKQDGLIHHVFPFAMPVD
jgi:hypothetical protein